MTEVFDRSSSQVGVAGNHNGHGIQPIAVASPRELPTHRPPGTLWTTRAARATRAAWATRAARATAATNLRPKILSGNRGPGAGDLGGHHRPVSVVRPGPADLGHRVRPRGITPIRSLGRSWAQFGDHRPHYRLSRARFQPRDLASCHAGHVYRPRAKLLIGR